jgi:methylmalonyl-CoA mutase N-terminal domain/subunit
LNQISEAAKDGTNLMPLLVDAVENYATLGEIADTLRNVFGEHKA